MPPGDGAHLLASVHPVGQVAQVHVHRDIPVVVENRRARVLGDASLHRAVEIRAHGRVDEYIRCRGQLHAAVVVETPGEYFVRVGEAGGRVRAAQDDGVELLTISGGGRGQAKARIVRVAGLHAYTLVPLLHEHVRRRVGHVVAAGDDAHRRLTHDGAEGLVFHRVARQHADVFGRRIVIGVVEAVRVRVVRVFQTQLRGLLVHLGDEGVHATRDAFRDSHAGVVAGVHEQSLQEVFQAHRRALHQPGRRLPHRRGRVRDGELRVRARVFQGHDGRHHLGDRGHRRLARAGTRPQDVAVGIAQDAIGAIERGHLRDRKVAIRDARRAYEVRAKYVGVRQRRQQAGRAKPERARESRSQDGAGKKAPHAACAPDNPRGAPVREAPPFTRRLRLHQESSSWDKTAKPAPESAS